MTIRWYCDLAFVANICIGKVYQLSTPPDASSTQKEASWAAIGMVSDWQDTPLGTYYPSKEDAKKTVHEWWENRCRMWPLYIHRFTHHGK